jgi:hypothetical protein
MERPGILMSGDCIAIDNWSHVLFMLNLYLLRVYLGHIHVNIVSNMH